MLHRVSLITTVFVVANATACFDLDSFVLNPQHCSNTSPDDDRCKQKDLCTPCGESLPWGKWGVPATAATQHPILLDDGETNDGWFLRADPASPRANVTMVYSHGNFGGLEHYMNRVALLWSLGVNVWAVDYRGFGQASDDAEPTEAQFMADARAAISALPAVQAELSVPSGRVVIAGTSAGALSAVEMAIADTSDGLERCALVLEAPWPSVDAFSNDSSFIGVPGSFVTTGAWSNDDKLGAWTGPYLQLHGTADNTVRIELGRQTFARVAAEDRELVEVEGAEHGNYLGGRGDGVEPDVAAVMGSAYTERLGAFIDRLNCGSPP
jgi:pimeloyl-ACP methyl ester carboxylesterase